MGAPAARLRRCGWVLGASHRARRPLRAPRPRREARRTVRASAPSAAASGRRRGSAPGPPRARGGRRPARAARCPCPAPASEGAPPTRGGRPGGAAGSRPDPHGPPQRAERVAQGARCIGRQRAEFASSRPTQRAVIGRHRAPCAVEAELAVRQRPASLAVVAPQREIRAVWSSRTAQSEVPSVASIRSLHVPGADAALVGGCARCASKSATSSSSASTRPASGPSRSASTARRSRRSMAPEESSGASASWSGVARGP